MKKNKYQAAFTLIEMIVYMSLLSILLMVLTGIFASALEVQKETEATSSVEQDGRFLLSRLAFDIERADTLVIPVNLGDTSSTLQIKIGGIDYAYSLAGGNLTLINNQGADMLNSFDTGISNLSLQRLGNTTGKNTIRVSFTVTSKTARAGGPEVKNYQTTIGLR